MNKEEPKLKLGVEGYINPGHIVNVFFTSSDAIFGAEVLYVPNNAGECWRLKTSMRIVYVQTFERIDLIR